MTGTEPSPALLDAFPDAPGVVAALRARGQSLAVAESCTGGLLGAALTAVPGSSDIFVGGVIAYANQVKTALLGVDRELLEGVGAVSEEVALAMARGVRDLLGSGSAAAVTGVAGPGAEPGKPAGLVFAAVVDDRGERVQRLDGDRGREGNRAAAVRAALQLLL